MTRKTTMAAGEKPRARYDKAILDHYKSVAEEDGLSATATMRDVRTRQLETELLLSVVGHARRGNRSLTVADVGCGNGYTLEVLRNKYPGLRCFGFEYTPELRSLAAKRFAGTKVEIAPVDIRQTNPLGPVKPDVLICQRVIINLMDADDQKKALSNLVASVRPGGLLILIESFKSGLKSLNDARAEFELPAIAEAHHNLYLEDDFFSDEKTLQPVDQKICPSNFLSTHYFVTRVLHPLMLGNRPFVRNSQFVNFFSQAVAQNIGDYCPIKAFAFKRKK